MLLMAAPGAPRSARAGGPTALWPLATLESARGGNADANTLPRFKAKQEPAGSQVQSVRARGLVAGSHLVPIPLAFEANAGQTDLQVKFVARGTSYFSVKK